MEMGLGGYVKLQLYSKLFQERFELSPLVSRKQKACLNYDINKRHVETNTVSALESNR